MSKALGFLLAFQNILFLSGLHVEVNTSRNYHNINMLLLSVRILTLSQGLCMKQGRGKQLNNNNKHQKIQKVHLFAIQESRIAKMVNVQGREEVETRVARAIYACGIPFNVVWSPYWQDMVRAINTTPQGFKGPNYEKLLN
jgi:hypothetical protein